jgi:phosphatidylserine synthase
MDFGDPPTMNEEDRPPTSSDGPAERTHDAPGSILSFLMDRANLVTLAGLASAVAGIYFAIAGVFEAAIIALLWAILCDWLDGPIARRTPGRSAAHGAFGGAMDSLVDLVSLGVLPAVILMSYGEFSPWFLPGAFIAIAAGVVRLSYFDVFGLEGGKTYVGLPLDLNGLALTAIFLFEGIAGHDVFRAILYGVVVLAALLNVSPVRIPKMVGAWYYIITVYVIAATVLFAARLLS